MSTTKQINPFREWLAIDSARPIDPYLLLSLEPLEGNATRISAGLKMTRTKVEQYRTTAPPELLQEVLDEIDRAYRILVAPKQKRILDASIRRKTQLQQALRDLGNRSGDFEVTCNSCSTANSSDRKFCGSCGECLWHLCPECDKICSVSESFCGSCGANISEAITNQLESARKQLEHAEELRQSLRFADAVSVIETLARSEDVAVDEIITEALDLLGKIHREESEHVERREQAKRDASQLVDEYRFAQALKLLERIPQSVRDEEIADLLAVCSRRETEIANLREQVKKSLGEKKHLAALQDLDLLITLQPGNEKLEKTARDLRNIVCRDAQTRMSNHDYDGALAILDRIADSGLKENVAKIRDTAEEMKCLQFEVLSSPYVTPTLLELAKRLAKADNMNQEAIATYQKIKSKLESKRSQPFHVHPTWATSPTHAFAGCPVEHYGFPQSFEFTDNVDLEVMRRHPGEFFVAIGLALQAIGRATVDFSLVQCEQKGLLNRFSLGRRQVKAGWGFDIGATALRAVRLVLEDDQLKIDRFVYISHQKSLDNKQVELEKSELTRLTIESFLKDYELQQDQTCVGLSGNQLLRRFLELPEMPSKKIPEAIRYEAQHQFPFALEQVVWNYVLLNEEPLKLKEEEPGFFSVLLLAGREYFVNERLKSWREIGLKIDSVQCDCVALHNFAVHEFLSGETDEVEQLQATREAIVLVDAGATATNIVICSPKQFWFRSLGIGSVQFTKALLREFQLTFEKADLLKRNPHKAKRFYKVQECWKPCFEQLASEFRRSLKEPGTDSIKLAAKQIYVVGGGSNLHGLLRVLRNGN